MTFTAEHRTLEVSGTQYRYTGFDPVAATHDLTRLPLATKILLENLLRHANRDFVSTGDIETLAQWDTDRAHRSEVAFVPSRVLLQDFTGVPAVVDLAAMREAMVALGGDPAAINPLSPVELVIDHSVMVDVFGQADAMARNTALEVARNRERYSFLRWGQRAFRGFRVVPPGRGIVHQVNLEYLARVVFADDGSPPLLFPDTLVGTDSHSTMINGLGVLGWGVGGIEAEAAMLGQPVSMRLPEVVGFELTGSLPAGSTATDLVLTVTEMLRRFGVVGKFVEFHGDGVARLPVADRATIANMAPEYGATCGLFPVDEKTLEYLRLTGRDSHHVSRVEAYYRAMDMFGAAAQAGAVYHDRLSLDLGSVEPSIAGPRRPQDRIALGGAAAAFEDWLAGRKAPPAAAAEAEARLESEGGLPGDGGSAGTNIAERIPSLDHGAVVIAAITSCTNTSNPSVMLAAGLLARNARRRGLAVHPWVKTSFAPGSRVVTEYLQRAGLDDDLDALGFHLVGYGCTTCIGNSGPLSKPVTEAIHRGALDVAAVLSGNRNFDGRIHPEVRANYLASPPLVVAYAIAGSMRIDLTREPLGRDESGQPVMLADIWPSAEEIDALRDRSIDDDMFRSRYADVFEGDDNWNALEVADGDRYDWPQSTYVKLPPFFETLSPEPTPPESIRDARCLVLLGDSVTTDHISPAGAIAADSPAAEYLRAQGVDVDDFNSYGSRRGNHEVMMRGTFANVRLRNRLAPDTEGPWTTLFPEGRRIGIFDAARRYRDTRTPLVVIAGREYGSGSSRDWAAKGPALLGVRAVIAESFERIHRSNLVGMGIVPLQFKPGDSAESLAISGAETFSLAAVEQGLEEITIVVEDGYGTRRDFEAIVRIDTPIEYEYFRHGGILPYVLRDLARRPAASAVGD